MSTIPLDAALDSIARDCAAAGAFGEILRTPGRLSCAAKASAEPAFYRLDVQKGQLCASLVTPARYLSQSIEADLVHTGDKLSDLLQEELVDLGYEGPAFPVEHYRDDDKLFTFRTPLGLNPGALDAAAVTLARRALLAYEATFRPLGDMEADDED